MKKINLILLSIIFLGGQADASLFQPQTSSYYGFMATGRPADDLAAQWQPPVRAAQILSGQVMRATSQDGTQTYFSMKGKAVVSFDQSGNATFSLGGMSITKNSLGENTGYSKQVKGTDLVEITNEFGEVLGYKKLGFGGKTVQTLDKDKNITATYNYNIYGKGLESIRNEMTKSLTVYDGSTERPLYELDVDGYRLMKYIYDDSGILTERVDVYGNITHYDKRGSVTYSETKDGIVMAKYNYKYDSNGNRVLDNILDPMTRNVTYFNEKGQQIATKNYAGGVITDYLWRGSTLVATFDRERQETTWYEIDGKALYTSYNDQIISKNLYYQGQLFGIWDVRTNQITVLQNERRELSIQWGGFGTENTELATLVRCTNKDGSTIVLTLEDFKNFSDLGALYDNVEEFSAYVLKDDATGDIMDYEELEEPTGEMIKRWIDEGLIDKKYLFFNTL